MMRGPGYIEGPWFSPEIRKPRIRLNNAREHEADNNNEESDVDLDDVDFIILPTKSRDCALRPGHAIRVIMPDENNSNTGPSDENLQRTPTGICPSYYSALRKELGRESPTGAEIISEQADPIKFASPAQSSETSDKLKEALAAADQIIQEAKGDLPEMITAASALEASQGSVTVSEELRVSTISNVSEEGRPASDKPTFFTQMSTSFTQVPVDGENNINTEQFLNACREIPKFLDLLGGRAMGPVKADMNGNISNLEKEHVASPDTTSTLQAMVLREDHGKARGSLLWLNRGLLFLDCFLHELLTTKDETAECVRRAYDSSLRPHHNFAVRAIFRTVLFAVPSRENFLAVLFGASKDELSRLDFAHEYEKLLLDARKYSEALHNLVSIILTFYEDQRL